MAKVPPPEYTRWKKGASPNPGGFPKLPAALRAVKEYTGMELRRVISRSFRSTIPELIEQVEKHKDRLNAIDGIIAKSLLIAYEKGDIYKILPLLERLLGKVSDIVETKDSSENRPQVIVTLPDNGRGVNMRTIEGSSDDYDDL